jgi:hypothetical protein
VDGELTYTGSRVNPMAANVIALAQIMAPDSKLSSREAHEQKERGFIRTSWQMQRSIYWSLFVPTVSELSVPSTRFDPL